MATYMIRRLFFLTVTVLLVTLFVFIATHLLPGDPIRMYVTKNKLDTLTSVQIEQIRESAGLNKSLFVQYIDWLVRIGHGDIGTSILKKTPVTEAISRAAPITLHLGVSALLISCIVGIPAGIICAVRRAKWQDTLVTSLANIGTTVPNFWLGIIGIYIFTAKLHLLPAFGYTSPFEDFWMGTKQIIMPLVCLCVSPIALFARQTRTAMLEVMRQDYIRTAWSKGLKERAVIIGHALKNGLIPVVTVIGISASYVLGGTVVMENVFGIPGMGRLGVTAMFSNDYPYIQGIVLILATSVIMTNLLVDIFIGWLDPRIRYG